MANLLACPGPDQLKSIALGVMPEKDAEALIEHLEQCVNCAAGMSIIVAEDTLVEAVRAKVTVEDNKDQQAVSRLVKKVRALVPDAKGATDQTLDSVAPSGVSSGDTAAFSWVDKPAPEEKEDDGLAPPLAPDEIGRLGPYRVLKVLGEGGMGKVFLAEDPNLQRSIALKVMKASMAKNFNARQRFLREARLAAKIEHDHIVHIYQVGEDRSIPFMAMQLLKGTSLEDLLRRSGALKMKQVLRIGTQIAQGLAAAHEHGMIHRDIKPSNIWIEPTDGGRVKILDFGLARTSQGEVGITQSGTILGTPAYMPPEQARGEKVDQRCDLYSLGCVLYRMATGELPLKGNDTMGMLMALALNEVTAPTKLNPEIPQPLSDLILKLLAKDPNQRVGSAKEVVQALKAIERGDSVPAPNDTAVLSPSMLEPRTDSPMASPAAETTTKSHQAIADRNTASRRRVPILAGVAVALFALIGGGILFGGQIFRIVTNQGELVVEVKDPNVEVKIVQNGVVVQDKTNKREFTLTAGTGAIEVLEKDGIKLTTKQFELTRGGKTTVTVTLQELADARKPGPIDKKDPKANIDDDWLKAVAAMPTAQQLKAVADKLKELNPDFDGNIDAHTIDKAGVVTVLRVNADKVTDISPVRAFPGLQTLQCDGSSGKGMLADLSPLKGMMLTSLNCRNTKVTDLSPLKDMKLIVLRIHKTLVSDLSPLQGMPLTYLDCESTMVADLAPLKGMPLKTLICEVAEAVRNAEILRSIKTLETINAQPAAAFLREVDALPPPAVAKTFTNALGMEFALVPKGKAWLGGGLGLGKPGTQQVEIEDDFYLGVYEVTQDEWQNLMEKNPSHHARLGNYKDAVKDIPDADLKRFPVEGVSWDDCQEFLNRLNAKSKEGGWVYRLPTETEWEYACRGGPLPKKEDYAFDFYLDVPAHTLEKANFNKVLNRTSRVGSYPPNRLGLYDMHGNVREWCNGTGVKDKEASHRPMLGGGWIDNAKSCRAAARFMGEKSKRFSDYGLRVARVRVGSASPANPPPAIAKTFTNALGMEFALVPKGKAWLGGGAGKPGAQQIEFKDNFYLGVYEVTQEEWVKVMGKNPSHHARAGFRKDAVKDIPDADLKRFPVEDVSGEDCQEFLDRLNAKFKESGWIYRLPTNKEWEYACRGGPLPKKEDYGFDFYLDVPTNTLEKKANFGKLLNRTSKVGSYSPNRLGLYDMHGNVREWCHESALNDMGISKQAVRGGSWVDDAFNCRAAASGTAERSKRYSHYGLRVARVPIGSASAPNAPLDPAWLKAVAAMPAKDQVQAVADKLKERNLGFDAKTVSHKIDKAGVVMELEFLIDHVTDIAPVRALTGLRTLKCSGSARGTGKLADLSPLKDMQLTTLFCQNAQVKDLSPLKDMKLTFLQCYGSPVSDLSPLKGMKLEKLLLSFTKVSDLSPLRGMPLTELTFWNTSVSDLSSLKNMPLNLLIFPNTKVSDLSPLEGMPVKIIRIDFRPDRDAEILRLIKTLESINDKPAAEFWKEVDAEVASFDAWLKQVAALPADKQVKAVADKLKERNPGFDGNLTPRIDKAGVVTELMFSTDTVTDIAPVRALPGLRILKCNGSAGGKGQLADLSPLKDMKLTHLFVGNTKVANLSPVKGMTLKTLHCYWTQVGDLSPLKGNTLTSLDFYRTSVSDLSPLKDMALTFLNCSGAKVSDLSLLHGMPLKELRCDFNKERDTEILGSIKTLETINGKSAAEFWKGVAGIK